MSDERNLTDADVAAIVDGFEGRLTNRFYQDVGKGAWSIVKSIISKIFLTGVFALAAYGAMKGAGKQ